MGRSLRRRLDKFLSLRHSSPTKTFGESFRIGGVRIRHTAQSGLDGIEHSQSKHGPTRMTLAFERTRGHSHRLELFGRT
jgi:hypothetical protein